MKPIIGIVSRVNILQDGSKVFSTSENVRKAIIEKGGNPFAILPTQDYIFNDISPSKMAKMNDSELEDLKQIINLCDGIIFPGGYKWYEFDEKLYKLAYEQNIPMLGICAGMQMMCKVSADSNNTYDPTIKNETSINHCDPVVKYVHSVNINEESKLYEIINNKSNIMVNSKHNYHVPYVKNMLVSAISEDGLIEGVEANDRDFVLGIQWHPETMLDYDQSANDILDAFMLACKKTKNK